MWESTAAKLEIYWGGLTLQLNSLCSVSRSGHFTLKSRLRILLIDNYQRSLEIKHKKDGLDRPGLKTSLNRTLEKNSHIMSQVTMGY